jgi:hypothetical protein
MPKSKLEDAYRTVVKGYVISLAAFAGVLFILLSALLLDKAGFFAWVNDIHLQRPSPGVATIISILFIVGMIVSCLMFAERWPRFQNLVIFISFAMAVPMGLFFGWFFTSY